MNNNGLIVGGYPDPAPYSAPPGAIEYLGYAYVPKLPLFYDVSALTQYGVNSSPVTYINDLGDITGPAQNVLGYGPLGQVFGITDDNVLIAYGAPPGGVLIARPGLPTIFLNPHLEVFAFNRFGQVVGFDPYDAYRLFVYKPDVGMLPLPSPAPAPGGSVIPTAINDSGLILFSTGGPNALLYDSSGSINELSSALVPIHTIVPPSSGWSNLVPVALNNAGQILVHGVDTSTGRKTSLLLSPSGVSSPATSAGMARPHAVSPFRQVEVVKAADCELRSLNGVAMNCGRPMQSPPRGDAFRQPAFPPGSRSPLN